MGKQITYRIGIDVGGTFTDLTLIDEKGQIRVFKVASTPEAPAKGLFDALKLAAEGCSKPLTELLGDTEVIVHGTTIAVNILLQRKAAKTGLICTRGFRHILYHRDGLKPDTFNFKMAHFEPYIPTYLTLPVTERIDRDGNIVTPLNEDDVRKAVRQFKEWNVEAIAVALLWSFVNPAHERRTGEIIEEEWPGIPYSLSSVVQPVIREWGRTSATAIDASLKPGLRQYAGDLQSRLTDSGFKHEFLLVVASGGVLPGRAVSDSPVYNCLSGPATGPLAGLFFAEQRKTSNVITMDMGGTSLDVALVRDGNIAVTRDAFVGDLLLGISTVEVRSIGAGGGSIAWIDKYGLIHVGPESVGAVPGPACYMRGGTEATVCDADVVLGYLDPEYFLGGKMKIDPEASARVIEEKIARPLHMDTVRAANAIRRVVDQNMVGGLSDISVKEGINPSEFLLVVGGGAGPMHCCAIASELGMQEIIVPRVAGAFCAFGMIVADIKAENIGYYFTDTTNFDCESVNRLLERLENVGREALAKGGVNVTNIKYQAYVGMRYPFQIFEIDIPLRVNRLTPEAVLLLTKDFHSTHEKRYSFREAGQRAECIYWRVVAVVEMPKFSLPKQVYAGEDASHALRGKRKAYSEEADGFVDTSIYLGTELVYGNKVNGPAIVEEVTSTLVLPPGAKTTVTEIGDYLVGLPRERRAF